MGKDFKIDGYLIIVLGRNWVRKGLKFGFVRFGPGFGPFLAKQVRSFFVFFLSSGG